MATADYRLSEALTGRYAILRELGQGGMATVYLAEDVRHERKVALKVLRPELAAVLGAERFLKEIKTTANLQHPHILPLHDSGEAGGAVFYVMPYVEGESLRDRLTRDRQLPIDDAVRIAREVLSALDYAHRHNVIHRDIKPENILLHDGQAFVADFGIALAVSTAGAATRMTETGMSLGTPHYMSPEQAMGDRDISARSDVYAMGCVLYEMLLGEPPFTGPSAQAIIARVITEEPRRMLAQRKTIPPHVEAAVLRSLAKLPADRFASAAEFVDALNRPTPAITANATAGPVGLPESKTVSWSRPIVLSPLLVGLIGTGLAGWALTRAKEVTSAPLAKFELARSPDDRLAGANPVAISPDGRTIAFAIVRGASSQIHIRRLAELVARPVAGTEGASAPMFSPTSDWIAFARGTSLYKVPLSGGEPTRIADVPLASAVGTWSSDGWIYVSSGSSGSLFRVNANGGSFEEFTRPDSSRREVSHSSPLALPDGRHLMIGIVMDDGGHPGLLDTKTRTWSDLGLGVVELATYVAGNVVFTQGNRLMIVPLDMRRSRVNGSPVVVDSIVSSGQGPDRRFWFLHGSASGTVVYASGAGRLFDVQLIFADRTGAVTDPELPRDSWIQPRFSSDGSAIVLLGTGGVNLLRLRGKTRTRVAQGVTPVFDPEGKRVALTGISGGLSIAVADGSRSPETLLPSSLTWPYDWSQDGTTIGLYELTPSNRRDISLLQRDGTSWKRTPFLTTPANERSPTFSPTGAWIAYTSDESGSDEVYVRPNPLREGKWAVSNGGGREPVWSADGREIFYRRGDGIYAVPVTAGAEFTSGESALLFRIRASVFDGPSGHRDWDVSHDGKRFIFLRSAQETEAFTLTTLLNVADALKKR